MPQLVWVFAFYQDSLTARTLKAAVLPLAAPEAAVATSRTTRMTCTTRSRGDAPTRTRKIFRAWTKFTKFEENILIDEKLASPPTWRKTECEKRLSFNACLILAISAVLWVKKEWSYEFSSGYFLLAVGCWMRFQWTSSGVSVCSRACNPVCFIFFSPK